MIKNKSIKILDFEVRLSSIHHSHHHHHPYMDIERCVCGRCLFRLVQAPIIIIVSWINNDAWSSLTVWILIWKAWTELKLGDSDTLILYPNYQLKMIIFLIDSLNLKLMLLKLCPEKMLQPLSFALQTRNISLILYCCHDMLSIFLLNINRLQNRMNCIADKFEWNVRSLFILQWRQQSQNENVHFSLLYHFIHLFSILS